MTISNNYAPVVQAGNGVTTTVSGSWNVIAAAYAVVQLQNTTTLAYTLLVLGTDYTIAFTPSGFTVTCTVAPATGYNIIVSRNVDIGQVVPFKTSTGFQGLVEENSFDKLTAICQDLQGQINSTLQFPVGIQGITDAILPVPVDGYFPIWSGTSGLMVNSSFSAGDLDTAFNAAVATATAAAATSATASASSATSSAASAAASAASATSSAGSATTSTTQAASATTQATAAAASATAAAASAASISLPLAATSGGTGETTYTKGDILYASATNTIAKLGIGSSGNVLSVSAGVPAWGAGASSELVLLATGTASSSSTLDFTSIFSSSYSAYKFVIFDLVLSGTASLGLYLSTNGGSSYATNFSSQKTTFTLGGTTAPTYTGVSGSSPALLTTSASTPILEGAGDIIQTSAAYFYFTSLINGSSSTGYDGCQALTSSTINAIRFAPSSGNLTSGNIFVYGVKNT